MQLSFPLFVSVWNRQQGQATPAHHVRVARWLESCWTTGQRRLLLMAFRSCGKSTLVGLFCAWLLYRTPELRILVLAAESSLARKMVRNVRRIIERHPMTGFLRPQSADQWAAERFTVQRGLELRDPSMLARGITSNITGSRADVVICDDVEVPTTCDTAEKRAQLREVLSEIEFVLVPGGTQLYVGTPHTPFTIYAEAPSPEIGEGEPFLHQFEVLRLPILDARGRSAWPERYPVEEIERMRRRSGPNRFASQMMLRPVAITEGRLDPSALVPYDAEPVPSAGGALEIGGERVASARGWWDPAFGGHSGDSSVLAIVYADAVGGYWLHRVAYLTPDPASEVDAATQQCRMVASLLRQFRVPVVGVEINGIGKFLPSILRREIAQGGGRCSVVEAASRRPKELRILEAFDAVLAARALRAHRTVFGTPFLQEMREWRPGATRGHDDGLDAVAGALAMSPVRGGGGGGSGGHVARTVLDS